MIVCMQLFDILSILFVLFFYHQSFLTCKEHRYKIVATQYCYIQSSLAKKSF